MTALSEKHVSRHPRRRNFRARDTSESKSIESGVPFALLLIFTAVTFLSIPNRIEAIAAVRPTVMLVGSLIFCIILNWEHAVRNIAGREAKWLLILISYIVVSLPLVMWPGSVITKNFEIFVRSVVFFFFVVAFVDTPKRLQLFIGTFIFCELVRCFEPLFLPFTTGYWGSSTYTGSEEMMRLAGAPADKINGNGLAFVIVTVVPFLHYWASTKTGVWRTFVYVVLIPLLVYTLVLTASRSGMVALGFIALGLVWFSKKRAQWLIAIAIAVLLAIPHLSENQRDRYMSLVDHNAKQSATAEGRIAGWSTNFEVFTHRPVFGFGLGTSQEAGFNVAGDVHPAHNIYLETLIELGVLGFIPFIAYLMCILRDAREVMRVVVAGTRSPDQRLPAILLWLPKALLVWVGMCLLFSLASYGLSEYQWYLFGGLAVVTSRLFSQYTVDSSEAYSDSAKPERGRVSLVRPMGRKRRASASPPTLPAK